MSNDVRPEINLRKKIKAAIIITIIGLVLNGISAFPLLAEMRFALSLQRWLPSFLVDWWQRIYAALQQTDQQFQFMVYGYDWLGFAHFLIAIAFLGPLRDPVRNHWVVEWGMISSLLSIMMALIVEPLRGVPFFWAMLDASVGAAAFVILWLCNNWILQLIKLKS